jgi:predicted transcriptional regulator
LQCVVTCNSEAWYLFWLDVIFWIPKRNPHKEVSKQILHQIQTTLYHQIYPLVQMGLTVINFWNYQLKHLSLIIFERTQIFNKRTVLRKLKSFMTEGPKFPSQANSPPPEFWKRVDSFSAYGLISVPMRNYFTKYIGVDAYGYKKLIIVYE